MLIQQSACVIMKGDGNALKKSQSVVDFPVKLIVWLAEPTIGPNHRQLFD